MRCHVLMPFLCVVLLASGEPSPVVVALDAEFSHATSTSAQAIELGLNCAFQSINAAGGVLGGRPLRLETSDNRSVPARGVANLRQWAARPDVVAVVGGKFSPVAIEALPTVHELRLPYLLPWSAADAIIDHGMRPSYTFRLSLRDSWAFPALIEHARLAGQTRLGLLLLNNAWGRGNETAAKRYVEAHPEIALVATEWFPIGIDDLSANWRRLLAAGAQCVVVAANEGEGSLLVRQVAALPPDQRRPLLFHWGITGGDFPRLCGPALALVDLHVAQTHLFGAPTAGADAALRALLADKGVADPARLPSAVGLAHAWDLAHLLAKAIDRAGSTDRTALRDALESLGPHEGLVRRYEQPWTAERHEALSADQVVLARFAEDGRLVRLAP
jgi:branched-chain amino acid transport system substrate-binding protein